MVASYPNSTDQRTGFTPRRKVREGRKERQTRPLCDSLCLSVLARVVFPDFLVPWGQAGPTSPGWLKSRIFDRQRAGISIQQEYYERSHYDIENKGRHCRNDLKRTHFERQVCRLNLQIELSLHALARAGGPRRKHTARFDDEPTCGASQSAREYKNSGNEAKKYLKTKDITFL